MLGVSGACRVLGLIVLQNLPSIGRAMCSGDDLTTWSLHWWGKGGDSTRDVPHD